MSPAQTATATPLRDRLLAVVEELIDDMDDLSDTCPACTASLSGWCDEHAEQQARVDELGPVARKLLDASTDEEAKVIAAWVPEVAGLLAGTGAGR